MFMIRDTVGTIPTIELADERASSLAVIAPARGGMATRFSVCERDVLYLDFVSYADFSTNVRGGVPVLFPSPGRLAGDAWSNGGKAGVMRQHGFARTLPWEVTSRGTEGSASVTLALRWSEQTLAQFPWRFSAELRYALAGFSLRIEQTIKNEDSGSMPFGLGFHPYFNVPDADKALTRIPTSATRAFDNVTKREVAFDGFDLTRSEVDLHLVDHGSSQGALVFADGARVVLRGSPEFKRWVVWTLGKRDFVCLEPWTCPANAFNTGEGLLVLEPGASRTLTLEIAFQPATAG